MILVSIIPLLLIAAELGEGAATGGLGANPLAPGECKDADAMCPTWARLHCQGPFSAWMTQNCPKSCKLCTPACSDKDKFATRCPGWAAKYCTGQFESFMTKNCPKSCNKCGGEAEVIPVVLVDCEVSAWSSWSPCNATCGGGSMERTRNVTTKPEGEGDKCPSLSESQSCNAEACPGPINTRSCSWAKPNGGICGNHYCCINTCRSLGYYGMTVGPYSNGFCYCCGTPPWWFWGTRGALHQASSPEAQESKESSTSMTGDSSKAQVGQVQKFEELSIVLPEDIPEPADIKKSEELSDYLTKNGPVPPAGQVLESEEMPTYLTGDSQEPPAGPLLESEELPN